MGLLGNEITNDITRFLDKQAGLGESGKFHHYILSDMLSKKDGVYPIRVPGGTVGGLHVNPDTMQVTEINVDTGYVVKTYKDDTEDAIQQFVGTELEL